MDLTVFATELAEEFTSTRLQHGGGTLFVPRAPVDLEDLAADVFPDDCDRDNAYEVVGPAAGLEPVIVFEWREDSAKPYSLAIESMRFGERAYFTMPSDPVVDQPWEAFAAVDNPDADGILDALLFDLLWDNGESYGVEILSSLPTSITSGRIGRESVRAAIHLYLDYDEKRTDGAWREAASLLPESMRGEESLSTAAAALAEVDSEPNRDRFMEAYMESAFRTV